MTKKIFYEKVGRRYKPVYEYDSDLLDSLPDGAHLVIVAPGLKSIKYKVDPALAPMIAAGRFAKDAMTDRIYDATELRPKEHPVTEEQARAWEQLKKAFGDDMYSLQWSCVQDVADAGVEALQAEAAKLLTVPAVKLAYDQFMLVCQLTKEEQG